jgi:hypothetical protein
MKTTGLYWLAVLVLAGCPKKDKQDQSSLPVVNTQSAQRVCIALPETVERNCGCMPLESPLITAVSQLHFSDAIRKSVLVCSESGGGVAVAPKVGLKVSIRRCVEQQTQTDAVLLSRALTMFDELVAKVPKEEVDHWVSCYDTWTKPATIPPRELSQEERKEFRTITSLLATGLLDSYQCQLLRAAVDISNEVCRDHPCDDTELLMLYQKSMSQLSDADTQAVCHAIATAMKSYGIPTKATVACSKTTPWFYTHGDKTWIDVLISPTAVADQVGLLRDIFLNQINGYPERTAVATAFVEAWSSMAGSSSLTSFSEARSKWGDLASRCEPNGCRLGLAGIPSTAADWETVRATLFFHWLEYFSQVSPAELVRTGFTPGCRYGVMYRIAATDKWKYASDGRCPGGDCQRLNIRPHGTTEAAEMFAASIAQ